MKAKLYNLATKLIINWDMDFSALLFIGGIASYLLYQEFTY